MSKHKKVGRPPNGKKAMTPAEKQKAYREKIKAEGIEQAHFTLSGNMVVHIDEVVEFFNLKGRSEVIAGLLKRPLYEAVKSLKEKKEQIADFGDNSSEEKEILDAAKQVIWRALCA